MPTIWCLTCVVNRARRDKVVPKTRPLTYLMTPFPPNPLYVRHPGLAAYTRYVEGTPPNQLSGYRCLRTSRKHSAHRCINARMRTRHLRDHHVLTPSPKLQRRPYIVLSIPLSSQPSSPKATFLTNFESFAQEAQASNLPRD